MTIETYLAIALVQMGSDAMQTHEANITYRWAASLFWSLIWPLTAVIMISGVVYRQGRPGQKPETRNQKPKEKR